MRNFFRPSGAAWLFWTCAIYLAVAAANISYHFTELVHIQSVWLLITALPLFIPRLARWLNMRPFGENT